MIQYEENIIPNLTEAEKKILECQIPDIEELLTNNTKSIDNDLNFFENEDMNNNDNLEKDNVSDNVNITKNQIEKKEEIIKDNGVLLISEIQKKVLLPYTAQEVQKILEDDSNSFLTANDVINAVFTKPIDIYQNLSISRFLESIELVTKREKMSLIDGINLGNELFGKRYLHPSIIAACKNLDELNVYLDCLEKNELDDFKIFEIKYEMYPMINKKLTNKNVFYKIIESFNNFFKKRRLN